MDIHGQLISDLLRLSEELGKRKVPFLLGGGMGLYVRSTFLHVDRQPRYPRPLPLRPTKDLDIFRIVIDMTVDD